MDHKCLFFTCISLLSIIVPDILAVYQDVVERKIMTMNRVDDSDYDKNIDAARWNYTSPGECPFSASFDMLDLEDHVRISKGSEIEIENAI